MAYEMREAARRDDRLRVPPVISRLDRATRSTSSRYRVLQNVAPTTLLLIVHEITNLLIIYLYIIRLYFFQGC